MMTNKMNHSLIEELRAYCTAKHSEPVIVQWIKNILDHFSEAEDSISFPPWFTSDEVPDQKGHYLVVQSNQFRKRYRWVRYWDGNEWFDIREEKYGPVTHWQPMAPLPRD